MKIPVAQFSPYGPSIAIALVASQYTNAEHGPAVLKRLSPHFPTQGIMLVSVEDNGFKAFATFQTGVLLALIQLEYLQFSEVDLHKPPALPEQDLPF